MKLINIIQADNKVYEGPIFLADSFWDRFIGLMGKKRIDSEEGIFFKNVDRIHTSFMKFPIDVVYFDKDYTVIFIETVYPWRLGSKVKNAKHILELNQGKGQKLKVNNVISII